MSPKSRSLLTRAVHAGRDRHQIPHTPLIDLSTTTRIADLEQAISSIDDLNGGKGLADNPIYARLHNTTVAGFEAGLAELEEAEACVAFASGMAAITALLLSAAQLGKKIVALRPIYGGTDALLSSELLPLSVVWSTPEQLQEELDSEVALIWVETPANPTCHLHNIATIVKQAQGIPVVVDSTFATPVLQQPLSLGASYVIHSATKFIGGHSDVLAGVILCSESDAQPLRKIRLMTGANLHPLSGYLLHRGLQTLPLRVLAAQENASFLAQKLLEHPSVSSVFHPSLQQCDPEGLVGRQMSGPGSLLAFELQGGLHEADRFMKQLKLSTPAVSLGSVDTLIQHPAGLTHRNATAESRLAAGITEGLLRVSVGIEDKEDLWLDIKQALQ